VTISLRNVRLLAYALVAIQVAQGAPLGMGSFQRTYWVANYDHGFVRRGLTGTLLQVIAGRRTETSILVAGWVVVSLATASLILVVELLLRRATTVSCILALLVASSPFTIDSAFTRRGPDQLAIPLLVLLGVGLVHRPKWKLRLCGAAGVLFATLVFFHEGVVLEFLPFALVMVVLVARWGKDRWRTAETGRALACVALPSLAAGVVVLAYGRPSVAQILSLRQDAASAGLAPDAVNYFHLNLRQSLDIMANYPRGPLTRSMAIGISYAVAYAVALRRWAGRNPALDAWRASPFGPIVVTGTLAAVVVLFATGHDWLRWWATLGGALLIVVSVTELACEAPSSSSSESAGITLPWALPVVAMYLAMLTPMFENASRLGDLKRAFLP
jgi:hypothetical protein